MHARKGTRFTNKEGDLRKLKPQWVARPVPDNPKFPNIRKSAPQGPIAKGKKSSWKARPRRTMLYMPLEPSMAEVREEVEKGTKEANNEKENIGFRLSTRCGGKNRIPQEAKERFLSSARRILTKRRYHSLASLFAQDKTIARACRRIVERMVMEKLDEEVGFIDSKNESSPHLAIVLMEAIERIRKILGPDAEFCWELDEEHEVDMLEELCEDPLGSHYVQSEVDEQQTKFKMELIIARMTGKLLSLESFRLPEIGETLEKSLGTAGRLRVRGMLIKGETEPRKEIIFEGTSLQVGQRIFPTLKNYGIFREVVEMPTKDNDTAYELPRGKKLVISKSSYNGEYEVSVHAPMTCYHLDFRLK